MLTGTAWGIPAKEDLQSAARTQREGLGPSGGGGGGLGGGGGMGSGAGGVDNLGGGGGLDLLGSRGAPKEFDLTALGSVM